MMLTLMDKDQWSTKRAKDIMCQGYQPSLSSKGQEATYQGYVSLIKLKIQIIHEVKPGISYNSLSHFHIVEILDNTLIRLILYSCNQIKKHVI